MTGRLWYLLSNVRPRLSSQFSGMVLLLCCAGCQPTMPRGPACLDPEVQSGTAIARVGNVAITREHVEQRIKAQTDSRRQFDTKAVREMVEDQIRFELLVRTAMDRGLARDPDVIDAARKVMVRKLLQRDLDPAVFEEMVGEDALRAFYERHRDNYLQPEKRRFAHIQLAATEDGRVVAMNLIERLQARPNDPAVFVAAAARYSTDQDTRTHGGDLAFQTRDDVTEGFGLSFANTVFELDTGNLAPQPVSSIRGWHVVKLVARREALTRDFAEVRDQIREKLMQSQRSKQFQQYLTDIRQTYPVAIYEDRLQTMINELSKPHD